ncbi:FCD domain-containing protein [Blastococcus mobilis]|uniref:FCD domain-containing protein n=1 Tax=Blastococcus mobilis TaxID=1938746 RepID=A0A239A9U0_9ACTN|nr:FCD domain-containing protein [Blastococcus mobilis]
MLLDFADRLQNRQAVMLHLSLATIDAHASQLVDEHRALIDAARRGDFDRFADLLRAHMGDEPTPRFGLA